MHQSTQPFAMFKEVLLIFFFFFLFSFTSTHSVKLRNMQTECLVGGARHSRRSDAPTHCINTLHPSHRASWRSCFLVLLTGTRLCSDKAFYSRATLLPAISNLSSICISSASDLLPLSKSQRSEKVQKNTDEEVNRRGGGEGREGVVNSSAHLLNKYACTFIICMGAWQASVKRPASWWSPRWPTQREKCCFTACQEDADRVGSHVYIAVWCNVHREKKKQRIKAGMHDLQKKKKTLLIVCKPVSTRCERSVSA